MRCIPVLPGSPKLQSYLLHSSDRPRPFNVSVIFSFSLLLFCFLVWYSHIESARCVIVYHSCVPVHTSKRSMSRLSNPITPTDFLLLRTAYHIFTIFPWLFLVSIGQKLCEYRLATHTLSPERDNVVYWKTNGKINNDLPYSYAYTEPTRIYIDVCMYHNVHVLILSDMYIHVYTCVHVHTGRVLLWKSMRMWCCLHQRK